MLLTSGVFAVFAEVARVAGRGRDEDVRHGRRVRRPAVDSTNRFRAEFKVFLHLHTYTYLHTYMNSGFCVAPCRATPSGTQLASLYNLGPML
jgi:hypothetical protein